MSQLSVGTRRRKWKLLAWVLLFVGWLGSHPAHAAKRYVRKTIQYRSIPFAASRNSTLSRPSSEAQVWRGTGSISNNKSAAAARTILIWISRRAPRGVSEQQWRHSIRAACAAWFEPAGCVVQTVSDRSSAEILFNVADLGSNIMGQSRIPSALAFPRVPSSYRKARVFVNRSILSLGHRNLIRTLKHEVGHVIGLPHDSRSVVGRYHSDLTIHDERMIDRFRSHLDRNWASANGP